MPQRPSAGTPSRRSPQNQKWIILAICAAFVVPMIACGKKGPPLPPLVKLPSPPADITAERRGDAVDITLTVPGTNTDGTRPANVASVDVYAVTLPLTAAPITEAQILKMATKVASLEVKAPADPNDTAEADDPDEVTEPLEGKGLDQGVVAHVHETLTPAMMKLAELPKDKKAPPAPTGSMPLAGPPPTPTLRTYAMVGVSAKGKKGPLSKRVTVPLVPPPPPPASMKFGYDEKAVTLTWSPVAFGIAGPGASDDVLQARVLNASDAVVAYNVYDVSGPEPVKLTKTAIAAATFADARITFGEKRCYVVRTAATISAVSIESDASPTSCETLVDTFAPATPKAVNAVPSDGVINLIWEPNTEKDLAGYIVLRAMAPSEDLQPITKDVLVEASFKDVVPAGVRYVYAVRAVDKSGNASASSNRVEETAR
jgi:hypothetical protein